MRLTTRLLAGTTAAVVGCALAAPAQAAPRRTHGDLTADGKADILVYGTSNTNDQKQQQVFVLPGGKVGTLASRTRVVAQERITGPKIGQHHGNRLVIWNDRATPARATCSGLRPVRSRLPSMMHPAVGLWNPVSRWNSVVLPAPFGPTIHQGQGVCDPHHLPVACPITGGLWGFER